MNEDNIHFAYYTYFNYLFFIDCTAHLIIVCLLVLTVDNTKILLFFSMERLLRVGSQNSPKWYFHI